MDDNVIISSTQQTVGMNAANVSLLKLGTLGQTIVGIVVTSVVVAATIATVILIGTGVGYQPPVTKPDSVFVFKPDSLTIYPLNNDKDPKGSKLRITKVTQPTFGTVSINTDLISVTYRGNGVYSGQDLFEYTVSNDKLSSKSYVNVTVMNRAPECTDFEFSVSRNSKNNAFKLFEISQEGRSISDVDNDELFLLNIEQPSVSGLANFDNKTIYYTPAHQFSLSESLVYRVTDRNETCNGTVVFHLRNDAPVAQVDSFRLRKNLVHSLDLLANDYDVNGDEITITYIGFSKGNTLLNANRSLISYWASSNTEPYLDSIEYQISDFEPLNSTSFATIEVYNTAPVAVNKTVDVVKNTADNKIVLEFSDIDELDILTAYIIRESSHGSARLVETKEIKQVLYAGETWFEVPTYYYTLLYTPSHGSDIDDFVQFRVTDSYDESTGFINFVLLNTAPVANDDYANCSRNKFVNIDVIANDIDADGDDMEVVLDGSITTAQGGKVTKVSSKVLRYTAPATFVGGDSFTYTVRDVVTTASKSKTATATVSINVFNEAPIAKDDSATVLKKKSITIDVLNNDVEPNNDPMIITFVSHPDAGSSVITISPDKKTVQFKADTTVGKVSFTYTVSDDLGLSGTATVVVDIKNSVPVVQNDAVSTFWNRSVSISPLSNDSDADGDVIRISTYTQPNSGTLTLSGDKFLYVPNSGFVGVDSFTYSVTDGIDTSAFATVTISVVNTAPVATADMAAVHWRIAEGVTIDVLANDSDAQGDTLYVQSVSQPQNGATTVVVLASGRLGVRYVPNQPFVGTETFKYYVSDWDKVTEGTVTVSVTNALPIANNDAYSLHWRTGSLIFNVLTNDVDSNSDPIKIVSSSLSVSPASVGSASIVDAVAGTIKFTVPANEVLGTCSFPYSITDGAQQSSSPATVAVTVTNANKPSTVPISRTIHWRTLQTAGYTEFAVYNTLKDLDGDDLTLSYTNPTNGVVTKNTVPDSPSTLRFSSTSSWKKGSASFTYTLDDGASSNTSAISVTVYNNAPVAAAIAFELDPQYINSGIDIDVLAKATDKDSEDVAFLNIKEVQRSTGNGTATIVDGKIHYQPKANCVGTDFFTYIVNDGLDNSTNTIAITVKYTSVQASQKYYSFHWRDIQSGVSLNLTEGIMKDNLSITKVLSSPTFTGTVVIQANKQNVTYTPVAKTIGVIKFAVSYTDTITTETITVTITITNTAPTAPNMNLQRHWRDLTTTTYGGFDVLTSASDVNGDTISLNSAALVAGTGTVSLSSNKVVYKLGSPVNGLYYVGSGDIRFSYTITDQVQSFTALADVNVTNDAPVPLAKSYSVHWASYKTGSLLDVVSGATDINGDTVTLYSVGSVTPSSAASVVLSSGQAKITGTPPASLIGNSFSFAYTVSDGASIAQQIATVTVTNEAPVAKDVTASVHWRSKNIPYVVAQTPTTDSDTITVISITSNQGSTASRITSTGNIINYTPPANFEGVEILMYTVSDGIQTDVGQAIITVFNNAPTAKSYSLTSHWSTNPSYSFTAQADATDPDSADKTYLTVQSTLVGLSSTMYSVSNGIITLTPSNAIKATGSLTVTYTISDGRAVAQGTISLTFTNVAPVAPNKNVVISRTYGQSRYTLTGSNVLMAVGAVDSDSDPLTLSILSGGQKTGNGNDVDVTIPEYFASSIQVQYVYSDGLVNSNVGTATVTFTNSAPVCQPASIIVAKGKTASVTVVCTDTNRDPVAISATNLPSGLSLSGSTFTFVAPTGVKVSYSVPFTGKDGVGATGGNTLTITVTSQPPTANDYTWNILARRDSRTHTLNYLTASSASDPDGDALTLKIESHTCTGAESITLSQAGVMTLVRPFTYSTANCQIKVSTTDPDMSSVIRTVYVVITTSGLNAVGRSIIVDHKEGTFFTMTDVQVMLNDNDPLGGTLAFDSFYVSPADGCSAATPPANGFCGNVSPTSPSAGTWKFSQTSVECQTQRFRYKFHSVQDPAQVGYAIFDVRFQNCKCVKPLDIVFVLDGSGSVGQTNFDLMKSFIKQIVAPLDIGNGPTQTQIGIVQFDNRVFEVQTLSPSKSTINSAIDSLYFYAGSTNIRSGVLSAEKMLKGTNSRGANVPKMIITIFDGEPNMPCSCSNCASGAAYLSTTLCQSSRYPARDCNHCTSAAPLKCNPCGDVLAESRRINAKKPGNSDGYWRIMSIGVGPYLNNLSAKNLIRDLSYNKDLSLSVDWNQLSTVVSTIQSQSCDLVDTSVPSDTFQEGYDIYAYCGQIVGISTGSSQWYVSAEGTQMTYTSNAFNPTTNRANLFQIVCNNFGTKINFQTTNTASFALWSLQTEKYVVRTSNKLYANGASPQYYNFRTAGAVTGAVPSLVGLYIQASPEGSYVYNSPLTLSSVSSSYFTLVFVSYNDIAYKTGLRTPSTFPVPITDVTKTGAV